MRKALLGVLLCGGDKGSQQRDIRRAKEKALSKDGDPRLSALLGVIKTLGIKLTAVPADSAPAMQK